MSGAERARPLVEEGLIPGGTLVGLRDELDRFRDELRAAGLRESTVHSYLMGSTLFVRWLAGDYEPGPGRVERE